MAFVIPSIFTAIDKFSSPVKGMGRNLEAFASKADSAISRQERLFRKMTPALSETSKQFLSFASSAAIATAVVGGAAFSAKSIMDYETELANLQAVTGASGKDFEVFKGKIKSVADETKTSAVTVAQAFTAIANNQPELLKDAAALAAVTKSSIMLAQASKMELKPAGEALTQILNQFGKGAMDAAKTVDILAAGSVAGSSEIRDTADAIQKFGTVAANAGIKIDESVALIELASKFEKGAEAGSKLRNILITMSTAKVQDPKAVKDMHRLGVNMNIVANKALPLSVRLAEMGKVAKDDAALFHIFGKENQALATGVLNNAAAFGKMQEQVNTAGMAAEMAKKNNATLAIGLQQLKDKFVTWLVTSDEAAVALDVLRRGAIFLANNLSTILKVTGYIVGAFIAWRVALYASRVAMIAYQVVLGVYNAVTKTSTVYTSAQTVAMYAQKVAAIVLSTGTGILTAAQWALNAAMMANPVALVVLAIMALVAALVLVIANYKSIEELHAEAMAKDRAEGLKAETDQINFAAKAYEKYGYTAAEAHKRAIQDTKEFNLSEAHRLQDDLSKATTDDQRRVVELGMATLEGRMKAVNAATVPSDEVKTLNPKAAANNAMMNSVNTNNAKIDINLKDPAGMVGSVSEGTDQSFLNVKTTSTLTGK